MNVQSAQQEMRHAWFAGAPGVLVSAAAWMVAALATAFVDVRTGIVTLLVGGMLIHPVGMLLVRALGRPARQSAGNPFAGLAMESTVQMLMMIVLALAIATVRPEWFFPAMLLVIGGRYLLFATVYGLRHYWVLGAALGAAGMLLAVGKAPAALSAAVGSLVEFALVLPLWVRGRAAQPAALTSP